MEELEGSVSDIEWQYHSLAGTNLLTSSLGHFSNFALALWILADTAAQAERGFMEIPITNKQSGYVSVKIHPAVFDSSGVQSITNFSKDDIVRARKLLARLSQHLNSDGAKEPITDDVFDLDYLKANITPNATLASNRESSRTARFISFIRIARSTADIGLKVGLYCSCLETLFSTDSSEVSHKVAERTACFLEPRGPERLETYTKLKSAYSVRSRVLHGAKLSAKTIDEVAEHARKLDFILRRTVGKLLDEDGMLRRFDSPEKELEQFLLGLSLA